MATPGMLYVTMEPKPELPAEQFHEWYNNEHGPTRLRLPQIFSNGLRYRETDGQKPTFLAVYDVTSMDHLETPTYLTLRANRSPHEAETIGQVDVKRFFYDLVWEKKSSQFVPIEDLSDDEAEGIVLVTNETVLKSDDSEAEYRRWYEEEHVGMLAKVPGWLRTRFFKTSTLEKNAKTVLLSYTEYAKDNGLGGAEHKAAMSTKWREEIAEKHIAEKSRRTYSLFYVFGPAPRDLENLAKLPASGRGLVYDNSTTETPGENEFIQSLVATQDGLSIRYRLEGNPDPKAPTVAFCNSLLTSLHMWDPLVYILKEKRPDLRILRFDTRGRHAVPKAPATLDILADDLDTLLGALRIRKLHALIGVSMGGATTLKFALEYPASIGRFIACDFNVASSAANTQAWKDRTALAESDDGRGIEKLATQTVARWFHPASMEKETVVNLMTDMVAANNVEGFKYGCQALWDYNMTENLGSVAVPGLLVVGDGDGKGALVKAMEGFKDKVGKDGVELKIVPNTGHLPMWEDAQAFWEAIEAFV
ncbi:3-oxoadipate enol-lactonase [Plectosphaerella plurivora]|uniref:3-oxoadipate enol-lactonase n=1 Tax=Plectosphaerella plurivora TaxID=936078 RepID=A0A9P9A787_9PEZI|nr:3-oxoadipate enol-lactonase [Plectosphaerella plurivora]